MEFQRLLDSWPDPANSTAQADAENPQLQLQWPKKFLQNHLDSSLSKVFHVSREIRHAVGTRQPVVALESTIYTHGFPYPDNIDLALGLEKIVRDYGGIPATIGVLNGRIRVGLNEDEITELASAAGKPYTMKVSRRDIPYITGMGLTSARTHGGTTVAATMMIAHLAGISVFGTGGLGGVHRGGQDTMDVSADLTELGRTPVAVISSGCKSFLDIPRTLEYLETQGVTVCTFQHGRTGDIDMPAFYTRESGIKSPLVVRGAKDAAAMIYSQSFTNSTNGILFANPIPEKFSMPKDEIDVAINQAVKEAAEQGYHGHQNTPFILSRIKELTHGNSIPANRALITSNVATAAMVAVELSKLRQKESRTWYKSQYETLFEEKTQPKISVISKSEQTNLPSHEDSVEKAQPTEFSETSKSDKTDSLSPESADPNSTIQEASSRADILVFGSLAVDLSCNHSPQVPRAEEQGQSAAVTKPQDITPCMHTSNIASIVPSIGGVGHNVALAAHLVAGNLKVKLHSRVANDLAGNTAMAALEKEGLDKTGMSIFKNDSKISFPTAQYVSVNDAKKNLVVAMADMDIFGARPFNKNHKIISRWVKAMTQNPKWIVIDANWHPGTIKLILKNCLCIDPDRNKIKIAYEPVSVPKSTGIFNAGFYQPLLPNSMNAIDLATPNQHELTAMHAAARKNGFLESDEWWKTIDALGISSTGARDRFMALTNTKLTDEGIPLQSVQLLPFIPTILTKLGGEGVLMTALLKPDDPRLTNPDDAAFILSRNANGSTEVGGVYMRLFPAVEEVRDEDVVSVNGVGDTFLGVLVAGLARGLLLDEALIDVAQRGAVMTLKSEQAVCPKLGVLRGDLDGLERGLGWLGRRRERNREVEGLYFME